MLQLCKKGDGAFAALQWSRRTKQMSEETE